MLSLGLRSFIGTNHTSHRHEAYDSHATLVIIFYSIKDKNLIIV